MALDLRTYISAGHRKRNCHCDLYVATLCGAELLEHRQNAGIGPTRVSCAQPEPAGEPGALPSNRRYLVGLSYSTPSIASADWVTVALLVLVMIPFIVVMGLRYARPLALQFSRLRDAAKDVAEGQFGRQAELIRNAPAEMVSFASDFNTMTVKLARYEKELRTSHVAMAHELRSPDCRYRTFAGHAGWCV